MVAYGLFNVPSPVSSLPSFDTTSNMDGSTTLNSKAAEPGLAVIVTVPVVSGVYDIVATLFTTVAVGSMVPELALKSKSYSGIASPRGMLSTPSVPMK